MSFYIALVFLPAFLIDFFFTQHFLQNRPRKWLSRSLAVSVTSPVYLLNAITLCLIYSRGSQFQGQGAIGLALLVGIGAAFSTFRLLTGFLIAILSLLGRYNRM